LTTIEGKPEIFPSVLIEILFAPPLILTSKERTLLPSRLRLPTLYEAEMSMMPEFFELKLLVVGGWV
jgi:hypothetical protein